MKFSIKTKKNQALTSTQVYNLLKASMSFNKILKEEYNLDCEVVFKFENDRD